ncbi:hypothetical protein Tco_0743221 [Tanacetum coccineum]
MPTEMELTLEQTQQGVSYEVSVDPHGFEGNLKKVAKISTNDNEDSEGLMQMQAEECSFQLDEENLQLA